MGDIPGTYDALHERRAKALRNFVISLLLIVVGLMVFFTVPLARIIWVFLLIPTFFGGYATGQYVRNWVLERLVDKGYETEDADIYGIVLGIVGGVVGCLALAAAQFLAILLVVGLALRNFVPG
jgi:Na+/melibiose symporter-like transporter